MTTPEELAAAVVAEGDAVYRELKALSTALVRTIKDEDVPHAELLLIQQLLDVRTKAQEEIWTRVDAALHPVKQA